MIPKFWQHLAPCQTHDSALKVQTKGYIIIRMRAACNIYAYPPCKGYNMEMYVPAAQPTCQKHFEACFQVDFFVVHFNFCSDHHPSCCSSGIFYKIVAVSHISDFLFCFIPVKGGQAVQSEEGHVGYRQPRTPNPQPSSQDLTVARK